MRTIPARNAICLLLAVILAVTGMSLGRQVETPVLGQQIYTGAVTLHPAADIPLGNLYLSEDQHRPVEIIQRHEKVPSLRSIRQLVRTAGTIAAILAFCLLGLAGVFFRDIVLRASSWRAIIQTIHRTRRKRC